MFIPVHYAIWEVTIPRRTQLDSFSYRVTSDLQQELHILRTGNFVQEFFNVPETLISRFLISKKCIDLSQDRTCKPWITTMESRFQAPQLTAGNVHVNMRSAGPTTNEKTFGHLIQRACVINDISPSYKHYGWNILEETVVIRNIQFPTPTVVSTVYCYYINYREISLFYRHMFWFLQTMGAMPSRYTGQIILFLC